LIGGWALDRSLELRESRGVSAVLVDAATKRLVSG
jgi:hypothetical protein